MATEICKSVSKADPFFSYKNLLYNFKRGPVWSLSAAKAVVFGKNVVHFKGTLIWNNLPYLVISSTSVFQLKNLFIHVLFENISHFSAARMSLLVILLLLVFISYGYLVDKQ